MHLSVICQPLHAAESSLMMAISKVLQPLLLSDCLGSIASYTCKALKSSSAHCRLRTSLGSWGRMRTICATCTLWRGIIWWTMWFSSPQIPQP